MGSPHSTSLLNVDTWCPEIAYNILEIDFSLEQASEWEERETVGQTVRETEYERENEGGWSNRRW